MVGGWRRGGEGRGEGGGGKGERGRGAGKDNPQLLFQTHSVNEEWMGEEGHGQRI